MVEDVPHYARPGSPVAPTHLDHPPTPIKKKKGGLFHSIAHICMFLWWLKMPLEAKQGKTTIWWNSPI